MGWPFCVSALPPSLGVGYGYASFFRLSGAIKNSHPLCAFTHSFSISKPPADAEKFAPGLMPRGFAYRVYGFGQACNVFFLRLTLLRQVCMTRATAMTP